MTGNNTLIINQATMNTAVEYYLNNVLLKTPCKVTSVKYTQTNGYNFEVTLTPLEKVTTGELLERAIANGTAIEKGQQ